MSPEERMLDANRRWEIVGYVEEHGGAGVEDLAALFGVSAATIRRDLTRLERQGLIERARGGAAPKANRRPASGSGSGSASGSQGFGGRFAGLPEPPVLKRATVQVAEKRAIGREAARYVEDGEVLAITGGTTTAEMIPYIADREDLTVITNALNIASLLAAHPQVTAVIVGGTLRHSEMSMLGVLTQEALRDLRADKLFMGTPAVHPEHGFSADNMPEVQSDRTIMQIVGEVVVVADHTKFGRIATMRQAPITGVRRLVTDEGAPSEMVDAIRDQGVEVHVAEVD